MHVSGEARTDGDKECGNSDGGNDGEPPMGVFMPTEEEGPYRIGGYNVKWPPLSVWEKECTCKQGGKQKEEWDYCKESRGFISVCHVR